MFNFLDGKDPTFTSKFQDMKKFITPLLFALGLTAYGQGAQFADQLIEDLALQEPSLEIGLGYAVQHTEGFGIPRFTLAANNLFGAGLGFYMTPEYRGGITFIEDGTDYYFRMPMGISFEYGVVGFFIGADPINAAAGKNWRKEIGIIYSDPSKLPVNFRLGYSRWVGPTLNVGYRIPLVNPKSVGL